MKFINIFPTIQGRQEDADEFLNFMLNGLHEEIVKITKEEEKVDEVCLLYYISKVEQTFKHFIKVD